MVNGSHANSQKKSGAATSIARDVSEQIVDVKQSIVGLMLESHLEAVNQAIPDDLSALSYGVSVSDGFIDTATTKSLILKLSEASAAALKARAA